MCFKTVFLLLRMRERCLARWQPIIHLVICYRKWIARYLPNRGLWLERIQCLCRKAIVITFWNTIQFDLTIILNKPWLGYKQSERALIQYHISEELNEISKLLNAAIPSKRDDCVSVSLFWKLFSFVPSPSCASSLFHEVNLAKNYTLLSVGVCSFAGIFNSKCSSLSVSYS